MKNILMLFVCLASVSALAQTADYNKRLKEIGVVLPEPSRPLGSYLSAVRTGNLIFLSGHGPTSADGKSVVGKVGHDLTVDQGYDAARLTAIRLIATLRDMLDGDLNRVKHVVKVFGMVNTYPDFTDQPKVINGCSDLLVQIFGDNGKHARSAVGVNSLPLNTAVEIEIIVEVE